MLKIYSIGSLMFKLGCVSKVHIDDQGLRLIFSVVTFIKMSDKVIIAIYHATNCKNGYTLKC